jgi:hypothetical protein
MEIIRVVSSPRGAWPMMTTRPASRPRVISRSSPYSKRLSTKVTHGPVRACSASAKSSPCLAKLLQCFASSHSYIIPHCSDFCSYMDGVSARLLPFSVSGGRPSFVYWLFPVSSQGGHALASLGECGQGRRHDTCDCDICNRFLSEAPKRLSTGAARRAFGAMGS